METVFSCVGGVEGTRVLLSALLLHAEAARESPQNAARARALLNEAALAEDWNRAKDEAWSHLTPAGG
jgi:hypothetical protein